MIWLWNTVIICRFYKRLVELDQNYKNILIFYEEKFIKMKLAIATSLSQKALMIQVIELIKKILLLFMNEFMF
jgi:hypothetical protein